jgi:hypothetical protein
MKGIHINVACFLALSAMLACGGKNKEEEKAAAQSGPDSVQTVTDSLVLPAPFASESVEKGQKRRDGQTV